MRFNQWLIEDYKSDKSPDKKAVETCEQCLKGILFPANQGYQYLPNNDLRRTIEIRGEVKVNINWSYVLLLT